MKRKDKIALERYKKRLEFARSSGEVNPFETKQEQKERIERAKKDYAYMCQEYFPHYATSKPADCHLKAARQTLRNPIIKKFDEMPRGFGKSVMDDILIPFWLWMNDQAHYMVLVTVSKDRASELLEDLRAEFEANPKIINDFGEQAGTGQWEKGFFITQGGFMAKALGAGQSVRGLRVKSQRPDYIVVDDLETKELIKNPKRQDEYVKWIERDLIPTMDGPIRRLIYANNRFAPVMIQTKLQERHPDWIVNHVKAYDPVTYKPTWPEKYHDDYYRELEKEMGTLALEAEYLQIPKVEGYYFKPEHIQYGKMPKLNQFKIIIGTWDVAYSGSATADYNSIDVKGIYNKDFWVIDTFVKRCKMRDAVAYMCSFQKNLPKTVTVHWRFEAQFWNDEVERVIKETEKTFGIKLNILKIQVPKVKKMDRILSLHPYYQNSRIFYNEKLKSHNDTQVGIAQLLSIEPNYKTNDDYPDSQQMGIVLMEPYNVENTGLNYRQGKMRPKNERI
ncbi:hypothetical protein [Winogradskyella luteola]|uniref:Terminase large subunit gp17-like C-terminal domain-containing protein n=1 Tax=Winogradskyella luteola TaxID=2828330 RepID=A0A9X1F6Q2_9FLAO|nr:hypothetical protein [Winogradskyella luteola]MBV7268381.1 hypothetical protein [Winogradskyella luteola]